MLPSSYDGGHGGGAPRRQFPGRRWRPDWPFLHKAAKPSLAPQALVVYQCKWSTCPHSNIYNIQLSWRFRHFSGSTGQNPGRHTTPTADRPFFFFLLVFVSIFFLPSSLLFVDLLPSSFFSILSSFLFPPSILFLLSCVLSFLMYVLLPFLYVVFVSYLVCSVLFCSHSSFSRLSVSSFHPFFALLFSVFPYLCLSVCFVMFFSFLFSVLCSFFFFLAFLPSFLLSFFLPLCLPSSPSSFCLLLLRPCCAGRPRFFFRSRRSTTHEVKAASSQESSTQAAANDGIELVSGEAELIEQAGGSGRRAGCWRCQCKPTPCSPQPNPTRQPCPIYRKCLGGHCVTQVSMVQQPQGSSNKLLLPAAAGATRLFPQLYGVGTNTAPKDQRKVSYEILYALFSL